MSYRIRKLAELVRPGLIPADIGTDHGLLPILLVEAGKADKAYACDIAEGPLSQAEANIEAHGLQDRIIPILSDGFANVPADAQCAVLAGMGAYTAIHIFEEAGERLCRLEQIIVQVNDDLPLIRRWISEHGFRIVSELTILDHGHFYTGIEFHSGPPHLYTARDLLCGPLEAIKDRDTWMAYAEHEVQRMSFVIERRHGDEQLEYERQLYLEMMDELKNANYEQED